MCCNVGTLDTPASVKKRWILTEGAFNRLLECLDGCLEKLPAETRMLIMEYYQLRKQAKIDRRKALAEELGIPVNALRIRAHRVRAQLEECVMGCLEA